MVQMGRIFINFIHFKARQIQAYDQGGAHQQELWRPACVA